MKIKILILMILLLCFGFNPAYSEELSALKWCRDLIGSPDYCQTFVSDDVEPDGDFGPPQPPTPQECGKIWQRCLDKKFEKTKCDLLKNACNNNWKL